MAPMVSTYKDAAVAVPGAMLSAPGALPILSLSDYARALRLSCAQVRKKPNAVSSLQVTIPEPLSVGTPLPPAGGSSSTDAEKALMFSELEAVFEQAEDTEGGVGIGELRPRIEPGEQDESSPGRKTVEALKNVRSILDQMWQSESRFIARAAEIMADASRDRKS